MRERVWRHALVGLAVLLSAGAGLPASAADFFASPTGTTSTAAGTGTFTNPWALKTALAQPAAVHPGDTIWLRGGTYRGKYVSYLTGTSTAPIVVRSYPGEWAKIDSGVGTSGMTETLSIAGSYSWFWGFEIMSSDPVRQSAEDGPWPTDINRGACVGTTNGVGAKLINLVCHDAAEGFELWQESSNLEAYGNIVYNNGWRGATDRGHGHGIYAQNANGSKFIRDNIILQSYDINVQIYGSAAPLNNFTVDGNIVYQAAKILTGGTALELIFGGDQVATNAVFTNNGVYSKNGRGVNFGGQSGMRPATVTGNLIASSGYAVAATFNDTLDVVTMTGNRIWGQVLNVNDASHQIDYAAWPGNTFIPYTTRPTGTNVIVRPNKYEPGRGHIAVFNWGLASTVSVDVSSILAVGTPYEVRNAQNFFGPPVASGTYGGGTITLPMTGLTPAAAIGDSTPPATGPEFNAFVVLPVGVGLPPPPPVAAFTVSPALPQTNVPVTFTDASTGSPTSWQWSFGDGGTSTLRNPTHTFAAVGSYTVTLTATNSGGSSPTTRTVTVSAAPVSSAPMRFYTVNPCRVLDTRNPNGPAGGPALAANGTRVFQVAGACGIPSTAVSVSVNATVILPSAQGQLRVYPGNIAPPSTSAISFRAGRTRANGGMAVLATDGTGTIGIKNDAAGAVHVVLDVNGYFR
jgi:PKD repeat protein